MQENQEELQVQDQFLQQLTELIKTWNNTASQANLINQQFREYVKTMSRIEDKIDHISAYIIRYMIK